MRKSQIGIFSGSFNPIHIGHLILANYLCEFTDLDEVWFLVTPQNPLKDVENLLDDDLRLEMTRLALLDYPHIKVSDIEFDMPRPSYTIDTLAQLERDYPDHQFVLIIGADNWNQFYRWKDFIRLMDQYSIVIYPRMGETVEIPSLYHNTIQYVKAPIVGVSSTFVREGIAKGKNMRAFLPHRVHEFIIQNRLYINV